MDELREKLKHFEDMIRQNERSRQMIENNQLKETIRVLISALRYERGVNEVINFIDSLPEFKLKESDINRICLFVYKKLEKEKNT